MYCVLYSGLVQYCTLYMYLVQSYDVTMYKVICTMYLVHLTSYNNMV